MIACVLGKYAVNYLRKMSHNVSNVLSSNTHITNMYIDYIYTYKHRVIKLMKENVNNWQIWKKYYWSSLCKSWGFFHKFEIILKHKVNHKKASLKSSHVAREHYAIWEVVTEPVGRCWYQASNLGFHWWSKVCQFCVESEMTLV